MTMQELIKAQREAVQKKEEERAALRDPNYKQCIEEAIEIIKATFDEEYVEASQTKVDEDGDFEVLLPVPLPSSVLVKEFAKDLGIELRRQLRAMSLALGWNEENPYIGWKGLVGAKNRKMLIMTVTYTIPQ
jgi:hypothetical protein